MKRILISLLAIIASVSAWSGKHWSLPFTGEIADQMELFIPDADKATGQAVLVLPGGGYRNLSYNEKQLTSEWFVNHGVMAIALSYSLPKGECMIPIQDCWKAMRYIREHAEEWHINPHQVGVIGFSAGGHLAASLSVHYDAETRPDFSILFYPVITMHAHRGTRQRLLGNNFTREQENYFSCEDQVTPATPPTFFVMASTDGGVPAYMSCEYVISLLKNRVYTDAHFYPEGKHGFCFKPEFPYYEEMTSALDRFMKSMNENIPARYTHKFGSYNIRVASDKDKGDKCWDNRKEYVARTIRESGMEIVGLQEIKTQQQLADLKALLPEYTFITWGRESADNAETGESVGIAYLTDKFTVEKQGHFFLTEDPEKPGIAWDAAYPRVAVWAKIIDKQTKQAVTFCSTHLDNKGEKARQEAAKLIYEKLFYNDSYYPLVVVGDLNTKKDKDTQKVIDAFGTFLRDSREVSLNQPAGCIGTWSNWKSADSKSRLDYMFVHEVYVMNYTTIQETFGRDVTPSDHFPVLIEVRY